jgi:NADH-quinone oxidoreductase subunit L
VALAATAIFIAYRIIIRDPSISEWLAFRYSGTHKLLWNKFYLDEIYDALIVWPLERLSRSFLWKFFDVGVIDGTVNGVATLMQFWSNRLRRLQSGYARTYANWILIGAALIVLYYYFAS